jgi:hypothetical protein
MRLLVTRAMTRTRALVLAIGLVLTASSVALANVALTQISSDPYTNTTSFHQTEVEPDTFASGSTIVATFQVGRFQNGGASNIGWSTSTNSGSTWTPGFLPGLTVFSTPAGIYDRATDPAAAYDAKHATWLINSLGLRQSKSGAVKGLAVVVNRSTDGGATWGNAVTVKTATGGSDFDKNWMVCDNTASSPFYGNCYVQWDDFGHGNQLHMSRSSDGGLTWAEGTIPRNSIVIGGQPLVQPNGTVVVPIDTGTESAIESFVSTNGGASYTGPFTITPIQFHPQAGNLRSDPLPSAEIDAAGKIYVVWTDCRFRAGCTADDIVLSTSTNGTTWTAPVRIPIDATTSGVDHFLPGLGVDVTTSGGTAKLALGYHYYPVSSCTAATCQLDIGYISSPDGGASWTAPTQLAGPLTLSWLPNTSQGPMVGDYFSTSFSGGTAHPVFMNATAGTCTLGNITSCNVFAVSPTTGLAAVANGTATHQAGLDKAVAHSNHVLSTPATIR